MRPMKNIVRVLLLVAALFVLLTTIAIRQTPTGTTYETSGVLIDLAALVVIAGVVVSWMADRRRPA